MRKWEYFVVASEDVPQGLLRGRTREDVKAYLNELGADGWEVVNIDFRELEERMEFVGVAKRELS